MACITSSLVPNGMSSRREGRSRDTRDETPKDVKTSPSRRSVIKAASLGSLFPWGDRAAKAAMGGVGGGGTKSQPNNSTGPTNETVTVVNGMRHKRLGQNSISVSFTCEWLLYKKYIKNQSDMNVHHLVNDWQTPGDDWLETL